MGKAVAERLAERLGFECLSRDVLLEASDQFNIPEIKLERAITAAPSILERKQGKQHYIAYIQSALTRHLCQDNVVYHGLAGHVWLKNVSHVLKVRIIADIDLRTAIVMEREKLNQRRAAAWIRKMDRERQKWTKGLYGVDPSDPTLYDLLLNVPRFGVNDAVDLIAQSVAMEQFESTPDSRQAMEDLAIACQVKAALIEKYPDVSVVCRYGNVVVYGAAGDRHARKLKNSVGEICSDVKGVNNTEVHVGVAPPASAV
jgi:cytidylate kinase